MKNQVMHWQYSMELQNQKQYVLYSVPHLLNILGLVTLAYHAISLVSLLPCMIWEVSMSLFKAVVVVCKQIRNGKLCCNIKQVDALMMEKVLFPVKYFLKSKARLYSITCELSHGATLGNDAFSNITLKRVMNWFCLYPKDGWVVGVEVLPVSPNDVTVMGDALYVISDEDLNLSKIKKG